MGNVSELKVSFNHLAPGGRNAWNLIEHDLNPCGFTHIEPNTEPNTMLCKTNTFIQSIMIWMGAPRLKANAVCLLVVAVFPLQKSRNADGHNIRLWWAGNSTKRGGNEWVETRSGWTKGKDAEPNNRLNEQDTTKKKVDVLTSKNRCDAGRPTNSYGKKYVTTRRRRCSEKST